MAALKQVRPLRDADDQLHATATVASEPQVGMDILTVLKGVASALKGSVGRHTEVVVHDLSRPETSIVEILNGHVSERAIGQSLLAGPHNDKAFREIIGRSTPADADQVRVVSDYVSISRDGRPLQSSSAIFHDHDGTPIASLCINIDTTVIQRIQRDVASLLPPAPSVVESSEIMPTNMEDLISEIIQSAIKSETPVDRMNKKEKLAAVATMHQRGLFLMRGSVDLVAKTLATSKFTVYNYLEELGARTP